MISDILQVIGSESAGVVNTGSGAVDLFAGIPAQIINLFAAAVEGLGS